jgi:hypothetical protein
MARILIAASPEPRAILERILAGHELAVAENVAAAERLLRGQTFDQIICTILFDESRMFDLLRLVAAHPEWRTIRFVCTRLLRQVIDSPVALEAIGYTCRALGAVAFLNIADLPEREMRDAIECFLPPPGERR